MNLKIVEFLRFLLRFVEAVDENDIEWLCGSFFQ